MSTFIGGALKLKRLQTGAIQQPLAQAARVPMLDKSKKIKKDKKKDKHKSKKDKRDKKHKKSKKKQRRESRKPRSESEESDEEVQREPRVELGKREEIQSGLQQSKVVAADVKSVEQQEETKDTKEVEAIMMTPAERRFKEIQMQRMRKQIEKKLQLGHREQIEQFNERLANLPEHFDIPKVGPG